VSPTLSSMTDSSPPLQRRGFPNTARRWQCTIVMRERDGRMRADMRPRPEPSAVVRAALLDETPARGALL